MARNGSTSGKSYLGDISPRQKEQFEGWLDQLGYGVNPEVSAGLDSTKNEVKEETPEPDYKFNN